MSQIAVPHLKEEFLPPSAGVDPKWRTDQNLRYWIECRPPMETFSGQFLDDMQEFIDGMDRYNAARPLSSQVTLLVGRLTDERILNRDMEGLGAIRQPNEFAILHRGRIYEGEYFVDGAACVYGIGFNPHRMTHNKGAFYFGYNPARDVGNYLEWLTNRNPFVLKPEPQP